MVVLMSSEASGQKRGAGALQDNDRAGSPSSSNTANANQDEAKKKATSNHNHKANNRRPKRQYPRTQDFMNLEQSHPYGILPAGNLFAEANSGPSRQSSSFWFSEHDEMCHLILSFCSGADLARLAQVNRFLYAATHQPEYWRDLVLRHQQTIDPKTQKEQFQVLQDLSCPSWKDTYVRLVQSDNEKNSGTRPTQQHKPHKPMAVPGVYSDYFHRLHSCRTFDIPQQWLEEPQKDSNNNGHSNTKTTSVPCIPADQMTSEKFYQEFEEPNRPVLIRQAAAGWKANASHWTPEYLLQQTQGRDFRATSGAAPLPAQFTMQAYQDYCAWQPPTTTSQEKEDATTRTNEFDETTTTTTTTNDSHCLLEEAPLYLFDRTALEPGSPLWKDYHDDLNHTCPYWNSQVSPQHDLFALLGQGRRPDHTWFIAGPKRSGSVFHMDPNATHAWNAAIHGRKRWIFYPPGVPPPGVHPSADADQVALPLTVGEWIFQFWDQHVQRMKHATAAAERPLEVTAFPGDVIFVPHGWWHMVINLDEGMNMAITHNYASQSNLSNVLKFLSQKRDQVSGCRDRADAIKPDKLHEEFVMVMTEHHPKWLQEAQAVPHWTCKAWSDPEEEAKEQETKRRKTKDDRKDDFNTNTCSIMSKAKTKDAESSSASNGFTFSFL